MPAGLFTTRLNFEILKSVFYIIGNTLVWISTVFTVISGAIYVFDNRELIKNAG